MRKSNLVLPFLFSTILTISCTETTTKTNRMDPNVMTAPIAKIIPHQTILHSDTIVDNYFWLRNREDKEVIDYLNAENKVNSKK